MVWLAVHAALAAKRTAEALLTVAVLIHVRLIVRSVVVSMTAISREASSMLALSMVLLMHVLWLLRLGRLAANNRIRRSVPTVLSFTVARLSLQ